MSDTTPPIPPEPTPPNTGYTAPAQPGQTPNTGYTAQPAGSPYASQPVGTPGPKQGLSLSSFIAGIAGLVIFSWIPILGFLVPLAAVILGFIAKGKEPGAPRWMWLIGIITGFLGIALGFIFMLAWLIPLLIFGATFSDPSIYNG